MKSTNRTEKTSWFLCFAVIIVNLALLAIGTDLTWPSPSLEKLKSNSSTENPLERPITILEASIVTSIKAFGCFFGPPLVALLQDRIGRKDTLILSSSLIFASHFIIAFATKLWLFYLGRFLVGIFHGVVYTLIPIYVSEITSKHNRGFFGTFLFTFTNFGKLIMLCLGPYVTLQISVLTTLIPVCIFLVVYTIFIPETPYYLVAKGKLDEAKGALIKLKRNYDEEELEDIKQFVENAFKNKAGVLDLFQNKIILHILLLSLALIFFRHFSGMSVIMVYLQGIFIASGSSLPPEISAILIGLVQFLASFIPSFIIDRYGRRVLLITSSLLACFALTALGASFMIESSTFAWLPLVSLIVYEIAFNLGLGPVPYVIFGELFPPHLKGVALAIITSIGCIFIMLANFLYPLLTEKVGEGPAFWSFAFCCALSTIFVYCFLPETKGKSLSDVCADLNQS